MYVKRILTAACFGILTAGMGSAFAMEDMATDGHQTSSSGSDNGTSQTKQNQKSSNSSDATTTGDNMQTGTNSRDEAMAQSDSQQASGTAMAGEVVRSSQGERLGRVAGALVDQSGNVQGYIVRTGKASGSGENQYVVVTREGAQTASRQSSGTGSMAQSGATGGGTHSTGGDQTLTERRRVLDRMYQQLQRQALEIRMLKQQLARQQQSAMPSNLGAMRSGMGQDSGQVRNAQNNPLSQVEQVVVDRFGRVQAIVLESGIVLASGQVAGAMQQGQLNRYATSQGRAAPQIAGRADQQSGQRRRAVIIFNPTQQ